MDGLKLHIGCGRNVIPGWINIDNSPSALLARSRALRYILMCTGIISREKYEEKWPKDIKWQNVSRKMPYKAGSVSKIYSSHLLEHMDKLQGERFILESFRVLKKGGIMRLVVPDLVFHARRYIEEAGAPGQDKREPHDEFLHNIYGAYLGEKRFGANHRYMYDWPTLKLLLKGAGFSRVELQKYRMGEDPELNELDSRPGESLHIDAVK